ncbi:hypothetical protein YPPY07_2661, partial [Yersinia pestis PY-07]
MNPSYKAGSGFLL